MKTKKCNLGTDISIYHASAAKEGISAISVKVNLRYPCTAVSDHHKWKVWDVWRAWNRQFGASLDRRLFISDKMYCSL